MRNNRTAFHKKRNKASSEKLKNKKAVGEDTIPTVIIKILVKEHIEMTEHIFNEICNTGNILNI